MIIEKCLELGLRPSACPPGDVHPHARLPVAPSICVAESDLTNSDVVIGRCELGCYALADTRYRPGCVDEEIYVGRCGCVVARVGSRDGDRLDCWIRRISLGQVAELLRTWSPIETQEASAQIAVLELAVQVSGLLCHPGAGGIGDGGEMHLAAADHDKEEDVEGLEPHGFDR